MEDKSYFFSNHVYAETGVEDLSRPLSVNCAGYVAQTKATLTNVRVRHDWYLRVVDTGMIIANRDIICSPRQFLLLPPEIPYYTEHPNGPNAYYWLHITGSMVEVLTQSLGIAPNRSYDIPQSVMASVKQDFSSIFHESILRQAGYEEMINATAQSMLIKLGRGHLQIENNDIAAIYRKRLSASIQQIHFHYTSNLRVSDLAALEHLSTSRYREIFRLAFGVSPSEYLMELRLSYARNLLSTSELSVTDVANSVGFDDVMYFCRLFHKKTGVSPGVFRKKLWESQE